MAARARASTGAGKQGAANPVVFDGRYINDRYHGIGRYAFNLVRELAVALPAAEFTVLRDPDLTDSRFNWARLSGAPNVHLREVSAPPFSLKEQIALPRALLGHRRGREHFYHTPYFALPWLPGTSALATVHDCIFEHDPRYMPKRWARFYYMLLMHTSMRRARAVAVPSEATAMDVRRFYKVPRRKLVVTPEAADGNFRPVRDGNTLERVRKDYALQRPFILAVGARRPHKNFGLLVQAFARLNRPEAQLVFVGESDERFPDEAAVAARGIRGGDRVRFLGKVPEHDLPVIYNLATAFAAPSLLEGFGLPVLEAMACGTPVVCSDIPVFREVTGEAAMLVPPTDSALWSAALDRLLSDEGLRDKLRATGLQRAGIFSWRGAASALVPVYGKILGSRVRR